MKEEVTNSQQEHYVKFEYDPELNIVFTEDNWDIETRDDVDAFFDEYRKYFTKLGKKVFLVSDINHLRVHAKIADYYGASASKTVGSYLLGFARWGTDDWARMTVRTTSLKARMSANIHETRALAIEAIKEMQHEQKNKIEPDTQGDAEGSEQTEK
jgi:hypothetical protein